MASVAEQTLNRMLNELINIREISARPAVVNQIAEFKVAAERERASLNAQMNAALTRERGRQAGVGIGETVGGVFGRRAADIGGAIGGAVGGAAATGLSGLASAASLVTGSFGAVMGGFHAIGDTVGSFVQKANPGAMERLNLAFDDVSAVIGQALTPVIEALTPAVRLFGDFLMTILPSGQEFAKILEPVNDFLGDLRDALASIAPFIKDVLSVTLKALGAVLKVVLWPFQQLAKLLTALFGGGEQNELKTSVGAAARNLSFMSAEQFSKNVNIAAFRTGQGGTGKTGVERSNELLSGIWSTVKDFYNAFAWKNMSESERIEAGLGGKKSVDYAFSELNPLRGALHDELARIRKKGGGSALSENDFAYLDKITTGIRRWGKQAGMSAEDIEEEIQKRLKQYGLEKDDALQRHIEANAARAKDGFAYR